MQSQSTGTGNHGPRLPTTLGTEFLVEISGLKLRVKSFLVGMEHYRYVIVKIFSKDLVGTFRSDAVKDSQITVMYMDGDIVYRFQTDILNVVAQPERLFFLKYPGKIEKLGVRNKSRQECRLPAQTMFANDIVDIVIIDLSKEGCQCMIRTAGTKDERLYGLIQVNEKIDIIVSLPGSEGHLKLPGIIRNISKDVDNIKLGVMFEEIESPVKKRIADFLTQI